MNIISWYKTKRMISVYKLRWFFVFLGLFQSAALLMVWFGIYLVRSELLSWVSDYVVKTGPLDNAANRASQVASVIRFNQIYELLGSTMPVLLISIVLLLVETYAVYYVLRQLRQLNAALAEQAKADPTRPPD